MKPKKSAVKDSLSSVLQDMRQLQANAIVISDKYDSVKTFWIMLQFQNYQKACLATEKRYKSYHS